MALYRLERARGVVTVGMNDVQFCDFRQTVKAIGTRDLKGCHVVIVVSQYGAILGHMSPRSGQQKPDEIHGGDNHIAEQMERIKTLYESYKAHNFFPQPGSGTRTIHAMLNGEIALPHQKELIEQHLRNMGLPRPTSFSYSVDLLANANADSSKGTVLLLGTSTPPTLLVEDSVVFPQAETQPVVQGGQMAQSRQASHMGGSSSNASVSAADEFTGWVYANQKYTAYRDGTIVTTLTAPPLKHWVYNSLGWGDRAEKWMFWDGKEAQYS